MRVMLGACEWVPFDLPYVELACTMDADDARVTIATFLRRRETNS